MVKMYLKIYSINKCFHRILFLKCEINPVIIILQILQKMDRITRVGCKKERDDDKSMLEEEEEEDTLKENFERTIHFGRYLRYMIDYSFRVVNKLFQIMMMEFSKYL